jgi:hypothetical protein
MGFFECIWSGANGGKAVKVEETMRCIKLLVTLDAKMSQINQNEVLAGKLRGGYHAGG